MWVVRVRASVQMCGECGTRWLTCTLDVGVWCAHGRGGVVCEAVCGSWCRCSSLPSLAEAGVYLVPEGPRGAGLPAPTPLPSYLGP